MLPLFFWPTFGAIAGDSVGEAHAEGSPSDLRAGGRV